MSYCYFYRYLCICFIPCRDLCHIVHDYNLILPFKNVVIPNVTACVSYKAEESKTLYDLNDLNLVLTAFSTKEHLTNWMGIVTLYKSHIMGQVVSTVVKHKFSFFSSDKSKK